MTYYGEKVLANFRPSKEAREKAKRERKSAQQRREGNSELHQILVRQLPCCICWKFPPVDCHHCKGSEAARKERGVGMKSTDRHIVPLCRSCHTEVESVGSRREYEFFAGRGCLDPYGLAEALWSAPRTLEAYSSIIVAHKESPRGKD